MGPHSMTAAVPFRQSWKAARACGASQGGHAAGPRPAARRLAGRGLRRLAITGEVAGRSLELLAAAARQLEVLGVSSPEAVPAVFAFAAAHPRLQRLVLGPAEPPPEAAQAAAAAQQQKAELDVMWTPKHWMVDVVLRGDAELARMSRVCAGLSLWEDRDWW